MSKQINIGGRLHSTEQGNVITGANEVLDDTKGKKQNVINADVDAELLRLDQSKQNNLTFDNTPTENSNNPVKSSGVYAADKALSDAIEAILILIPSAATALNQLADKSFVNSSIATDTATFRGTSETGLSEAQFLEWANGLTHDMNDYVFWQTIDDAGNTLFKRYKWNGAQWLYEYTLNNSSFTADQWAAIMSGITSALVEKLNGLPTNTALQQALNSKQDNLTFDNVPTENSTNPVKSGGVYSAVKAEEDARQNLAQTVGEIGGDVSQIEDVIPAGATVQNKLVANASMEAYVASIIQNITASFTITTTDGHINLTLTQVDGQVATLTLTSSDIASAQALTALTGRVTTAEGNITSLTGRVSTNETDIANLQQLYNDLQQSKPVPVDTLPSTGQQQGVIYRLAGTTSYSDYMWNGSAWVLMATYNNAIDDEPTAGSENLVKSGGVKKDLYDIKSLSQYSTLNFGRIPMVNCGFVFDYAGGTGVAKYVEGGNKGFLMYLPPNVTEIIHDSIGVFSIERFNSYPQVGDASVERVANRDGVYNNTKVLVRLSSNPNGAYLLATTASTDTFDGKYIYANSNAALVNDLDFALYADFVVPKQAGFLYNGSSIIGSNASYDSFIVPVLEDTADIFIKNGTTNIVDYKWFATKPNYGDVGSNILTENINYDCILKNVKKGYILATYNKSNVDISDFRISVKKYEKDESPYIKHYTSSDYSGIYYRGMDGSIQPADAEHNSFVFSIKKGARYIITGSSIGMLIYKGNPLGDSYTHIASNPPTPYLCLDNNYYMMIMVNPSTYTNDVYVESSGNLYQELVGKNIVCFGDSLTEFNGLELMRKNYPTYLSIKVNANVVNAGIGGSRYAQHVTPQAVPSNIEEAYAALSVSNLAKHWADNDWTMIDNAVEYLRTQASDDNRDQIANLKAIPIANADIVVLMAGANDFTWSSLPIGTVGEIDPTTIVGALGYAINAILSINPKIAIYVVTEPVRWFGDRSDDDNWCDNYELGGRTYPQMMEGIINTAKYFHIPYLNLYDELGWNKINFSEYFGEDNAHPVYGFSVIANRIYGNLTSKCNLKG